MDQRIRHHTISTAGIDTFYREAGQPDAPVILLPHGYPCSSFEFRNFMPRLADKWRLIAPDFPGFGYSDTPENFSYTTVTFPTKTHWGRNTPTSREPGHCPRTRCLRQCAKP